MSQFQPIHFFGQSVSVNPSKYSLLPFRFTELNENKHVLTNLAGEHLVLDKESTRQLITGQLEPGNPSYTNLRARHFLKDEHSTVAEDLLAIKVRTKYARLADWTGLHIFVLTLRCEHSCPYCQVSRQSDDKSTFDMSMEHADKAVDLALCSPNASIKIEFQGGESFLNFDLMRHIVLSANAKNQKLVSPKNLSFVAATNLAIVTDEMLLFCKEYGVHISTSLDGPQSLHNKNRPRPNGDSYQRTIDGIKRVQRLLGKAQVSALMTTTKESLDHVKAIIDEYLTHEFQGVFLRPLSPYGFALKTKFYRAYDAQAWLNFYDEGLDYIIELNRQGVDFREFYACTILSKMLTCIDPGYVDLMSPAGIGLGAVVYNYDGAVYASDEARMLAEMGDETFKLGTVENTFTEIFSNPVFLNALEESFAYSSPMCNDCAFEPWCGADPVFHWGQQKDFAGRKPESEFCQRNMHIFKGLVRRMEEDPFVKTLFYRWANGC